MCNAMLAKLIEHASHCVDVCSHPTECNDMKHMIRHLTTCKIDDCVICKTLDDIILVHSQMCSIQVCPVIKCDMKRFVVWTFFNFSV